MEERPNIIFLLNDHQTYYGHGKMAGAPKIHRPYFDKIAHEGIKFINAYTACPLCGPARRSILTGLYPHNHLELMNEVLHPYDKITYLELLTEGGYDNYYYGKWHAGPGTAHDFDCKGFSYPKFGNPYITSEYKEYLKKMNLPDFQVEVCLSFYGPNWKRTKDLGIEVGKPYSPKWEYYDESIFGLMRSPKETHEAYFLATLACEQLKKIKHSNRKNPFHMRIDFWGPHPPYMVSQEFLDLYNPKDISKYPNFNDDLQNKPKIYHYDPYYPISKNGNLIYPNPLEWTEWQKALSYAYAHISLIDDAGGQVLRTLDELGFSENTLVIWTSDHGDGLACHGGHFDKDCYMPQELIRIPLVIKYPSKIKSGQISDKLVSNIDLAPTILDSASLYFKDPIDGRSLFPIFNDKADNWREDLMIELHGHKHIHLGRALVYDNYKYIYNEGDLDELYNLQSDPYELYNLIDDEAYVKNLRDLKIRLKRWREITNDDMNKRKIRKINRTKNKN